MGRAFCCFFLFFFSFAFAARERGRWSGDITYIETGGEERFKKSGRQVGEYIWFSGGMSQYKTKDLP
jgi:hypothetical protein